MKTPLILISALVFALSGCGNEDDNKPAVDNRNPLVGPLGDSGQGSGGQWVSECFSSGKLYSYFQSMLPSLQAPRPSSQYYQATLRFDQNGRFEHVVYGYQEQCDLHAGITTVSLWGSYDLGAGAVDVTVPRDLTLKYEGCTADYVDVRCPSADPRYSSLFDVPLVVVFDATGSLTFGRKISGMTSTYFFKGFRFSRPTYRH